MKSEEIVNALVKKLPTLTPLFSTVDVITSLTTNAGIVTAITAGPHKLVANEKVVIEGAQSDVAVETLTRLGVIGTMVTLTDHDVTKGLGTIEIQGAVESEFNGTFTILDSENRRTIRFAMTDDGPTTATGTILLIKGQNVNNQYDGVHLITAVPNSTSFQYVLGFDLLPASGSPQVQSQIRISAAAQIERIVFAYTQQPEADLWAYVVLGDVVASKDPNNENDATSRQSRKQQGQDFFQQMTQSFSIYVFVPTSDELAGRKARDLCEDLFLPINQSVLFFTFDSGLQASKNSASGFVSHTIYDYGELGGYAFYVHEYNYEQVVDITYADTVGDDPSIAFRDIEFRMSVSPGTEKVVLVSKINLDVKPLPEPEP